MSTRNCRWGIMGTAFIARKNWQAIRNSGNGTLTAVGSRDRARGDSFVAGCQSQAPFAEQPRVCSYEQLLADPNIDAIYLPLPTGIRKDWAVRAARAGKHVVVEKPVGINADEVQEILQACRDHRVQFMDGVMFMHSERLQKLRDTLDDGESVGQIRRIATQFSFLAADEFLRSNIRVHSGLEPLGCLGDLGWYNIRFILWAMKYQSPTAVRGVMLGESGRPDSPTRVPTEFSGELYFSNGVSGSFYCSFQTEHQQWAHVSGTRGQVSIRDFVLPYYGCEASFDVSNPVFRINGCNFNMEDHTRRVASREYAAGTECSQETQLFRRFSQIVLSGNLDNYWCDIALKTQLVLDACLKSAKSGGQPQSVSFSTHN